MNLLRRLRLRQHILERSCVRRVSERQHGEGVPVYRCRNCCEGGVEAEVVACVGEGPGGAGEGLRERDVDVVVVVAVIGEGGGGAVEAEDEDREEQSPFFS